MNCSSGHHPFARFVAFDGGAARDAAATVPSSTRRRSRGSGRRQASVFAAHAASVALYHAHASRTVGRRERIGTLHGVRHHTVLPERRSTTVGAA